MIENDQAPSRSLEERKNQRLHIVNLRKQGGWLLGCGAIGIALLNVGVLPMKVLGFIVILIGIFGAKKYEDGLGYHNVLVAIKSLRMRAKTNGVTDISQLEMTDKEPIQVSSMSYPAVDDDGVSFRIGVKYNPADNCDTFMVIGDGIEDVYADPHTILAQEDLYIDGVAEGPLYYDGRIGVTMIGMTRPVNLLRQTLWNAENLDPDVLDAQPFDQSAPFSYETATTEERQATALKQSDAAAALYEADIVRGFAITVPRPKSWPRVKNGLLDKRLKPEQLEEAPVVRLALLLESELRQRGVVNAAIVDVIDAARITRMSWDMTGIQEWNRWLQEVDPVNNPEVIADGLDEWPSHEIVTLKSRRGGFYIRTDGTYHRVFKAKRFLKSRVMLGDFDDLTDVNLYGLPRDLAITASICGDVVNPQVERSILRRENTIRQALRNNRKGEYYESQEDIDRAEHSVRKDDTLYLSKTIALSYNAFFVLSSTSLKTLDDASAAYVARAKRCGVVLGVVKWEVRQVLALFTALLGVSMYTT